MDLYEIRQKLSDGISIYEIPMKVTYYARVSTEKEEQANSLKNQIKYYSDFIKNNVNWEFVDGYIDEGLSGTSVSKRGSFLRMIDDAKLNKFNFIITKEITRFSRNTVDSIKYTRDLLSASVGVLFQSDNINTLMPDSELRLAIMSSIAQDEVRKISERVRFGFKRAIDNGVVLGNGRIWGYTKENGKLIIDEDEAKVVKLIFEMYAAGNIGMRTIANELAKQGYKNSAGKPFTFSTIKNIIINPKYKGYYCGNKTHKYDYRSNERKVFSQNDWIMYKDEGNVPPIISEQLWQKANKMLQKRSEKMKNENTSYTNKYAYSGKILCAEHNTSYHRGLYKYKSGNKEVWQCKNYIQLGKKGCTSPTIYTSELNIIMNECIKFLIGSKERIIDDLIKVYSSIAQSSTLQENISKLEIKINELGLRKDKLLDLSLKGKLNDDEFEIRNSKFNNEIITYRNKIAEFEEQKLKNISIEKVIEGLRQVISSELEFKNGFDNLIIDNLVEKIGVYETGIKNKINITITLNVINSKLQYCITRLRNNTSVCSKQNI